MYVYHTQTSALHTRVRVDRGRNMHAFTSVVKQRYILVDLLRLIVRNHFPEAYYCYHFVSLYLEVPRTNLAYDVHQIGRKTTINNVIKQSSTLTHGSCSKFNTPVDADYLKL